MKRTDDTTRDARMWGSAVGFGECGLHLTFRQRISIMGQFNLKKHGQESEKSVAKVSSRYTKKAMQKKYGNNTSKWQNGFATEVAASDAEADEHQGTPEYHAASTDWKSKADERSASAQKAFASGDVNTGIENLGKAMHAYEDSQAFGHISGLKGMLTWIPHILTLDLPGRELLVIDTSSVRAAEKSAEVANAVLN